MKIKPIKQGVDGLCGIYAIMNSIHIALGLTQEEIEDKLFPALLEPLKDQMFDVLTGGTLVSDIEKVLQHTKKIVPKLYDHSFSFKKLKEPASDINRWLDMMQMHLDRSYVSNDHGAQTRTCLTSFVYPYAHWTLIRDVNDTDISLFDSYRHRNINHNRIFFSGTRDFVFCPEETFFITIGE